MNPGTVLRLEIRGERDDRRAVVIGGGDNSSERDMPIVEPEVDQVLLGLRGNLTRIHDVAGDGLDLSAARCHRVLDELIFFADSVDFGLFGVEAGAYLRQQASVRAAGSLVADAEALRVVEVVAPANFTYPFELLQWLDTPGDDLRTRSRALLGMSSVVMRMFSDASSSNGGDLLQSGATLHLTALRDATLIGARREVADIRQVGSGAFNIHGPFPDATPLGERAVAKHLMDSSIGVDGSALDPPPAIIHFACHAYTDDDATNYHYLDLGGAGVQGRVRLVDLKRSDPGPSFGPPDRPLVFMNACGTSATGSAQRTSFTELMIAKNFRGVLGTLCDISSEVASHFAVIFYEALLGGRTVGQAMHEARWHLMDRHLNPLGILYTFHGNPNLRLSHPREGQVVSLCPVDLPV